MSATSEKFNEFEKDLCQLINRHSLENTCNVPDFILARHMVSSLIIVAETIGRNKAWWAGDEPVTPITPHSEE